MQVVMQGVDCRLLLTPANYVYFFQGISCTSLLMLIKYAYFFVKDQGINCTPQPTPPIMYGAAYRHPLFSQKSIIIQGDKTYLAYI